jgi:hypothetical protein
MSDRKARAREIAARTMPRFVEIKPERGKRNPSFTRAELKALRENKWAMAEFERRVRTWDSQ